jgi:uroporphyrin-III C-methyltransferase
MKEAGIVYIVGAGPGDPDLITVKGLRCLRQADVVLHDRLVDPRLLQEVRPDAKVIDVGKRKGTEDEEQVRIHRLMVHYALAGKIVCRLKGGDPFVFGRAAEEINALEQAGVEFEVVPGLSSVTAVPTSSGVSLTERNRSHAFMVIAGSRSLEFDSQEWKAARTLLAAGGSVVVMMGLARVDRITEWLVHEGCNREIPATIVSRGTWSDQEIRTGTLGTITNNSTDLATPAILILGAQALDTKSREAHFLTVAAVYDRRL